MSKHTEGPWEVLTHTSCGVADQYWIVGTTPPRIANLNFDNENKAEMTANAALIAAAPDMHNYIEYVEGKIDIEEIPFTFDQWKAVEADMKAEVHHGR